MGANDNYTKRELDHFLGDIKEHLKKQDDVLNKILEHTTKTNDRVNSLEYWRNSIAWAFGAILSILLFILNKKL